MISKHKVNSFCVNHNNLFSSIWSDINKSIIKRTQNHFYLMVTNLISSLSHYHHPKNIYFKSDSFRNNFINSHLEWNHLHLKKKKKIIYTSIKFSQHCLIFFFLPPTRIFICEIFYKYMSVYAKYSICIR